MDDLIRDTWEIDSYNDFDNKDNVGRLRLINSYNGDIIYECSNTPTNLLYMRLISKVPGLVDDILYKLNDFDVLNETDIEELKDNASLIYNEIYDI